MPPSPHSAPVRPRLGAYSAAASSKSVKSLRSAVSGKSYKSLQSFKSKRSLKSTRSVRSRASRGRQSVESVLDSFRLNRRDSATHLLADEAADALDPNAVEIQIWQQVLLACLLFELCVIPFLFVFHRDDTVGTVSSSTDTTSADTVSTHDAPLPIEYAVFYGCELLFLLDLVVQAHTGYYVDGNVVRDKIQTRRRFLRSRGFWLDIVALAPLSLVLPIAQSTPRIVLELHKFSRCWRLGTYVSNLDSFYARHFAALKLVKVLGATMVVSHGVACARFAFGYNTHGDNHWLPHVPHHALSVRSKYLMSVFWAFGLLSGLFEGELPHAVTEFVFTIAVALCGFALFTSLCATFFVVSKCESGQTEEFEARINQLKHLLRFHRVPESLQTQAIDYLKRYYTDAESNDREAIKLLCPSIAKDIQVELLKSTVAQIPLFAGCSDQFIVAVAGLLEMRSVPAQFVLFEAGDFGDAMYLVHSGVLNVVIHGVKVREMRKGVCFGELSVFSLSPRTATVVSATYAILYQLSRFHSERVMEGYPTCAALIAAHVVHLLENAKKRPSIAPTLAPDAADDTSERRRSSAQSVHQSIRFGASLVRKSMTSSPWHNKKPSQVAPVHDDAIAESMSSPRPDELVETPRSTAQRREDQQTLSYYSRSVQSEARTSKHTPWWRKLLLRTCIDADSRTRMWWIAVLMVTLIYNWLLVPLQLSFPVMHRPLAVVTALNTVADAVLVVDLYVNLNLSFTLDSEKITDPVRSAARYVRRGLLFDVACVLPYWTVTSTYALSRVPRLFRVFRLTQHLDEVDKSIRLSSKQHLLLFGLLLVMLYHIIACVHFSVSYIEGFSTEEDAWIPCEDIFLRQLNATHYEGRDGVVYSTAASSDLDAIARTQYFRSLYYATNVLAALGKTVEPASDVQYAIAIVLMVSGFLITAVVVDNVQKRFTASAFEQKQFFAVRTRMQLFLRRQNAPIVLHHRMNAFLDYWWSSHRGAMIGELLADLPPSIRHDILRSICNPVLQTLALVAGVRTALDQLEDVMVENLKFVLYGQGEVVFRQGDYATGVFFLLEGDVCVITEDSSPRGVPLGGFFGTAALAQSDNTGGYCEHVSATSSCILLFLASEHLRAMEAIFPRLPVELLVLEKRLLGNKLAKVDVGVEARRESASLEQHAAQHNSLCARLGAAFTTVLDPDSTYVLAWELWLFLVMTVQWMTVLFQICFRTTTTSHTSSDAVTFFLEIWFFVDVSIRLRLGYYEYGNKVMARKQIRRTYLRSATFALDVLALVPLYMINWFRSPAHRLDVMNINKLLRLFKVSRQFTALENRFLKFTMELRLLKLLYYTFMLSHIFGCFWFDFATNASHLGLSGQHAHSDSDVEDSSATAHEGDKWMPPETLRHAHLTMQYVGSIVWAFGLMSASQTGELPKTVPQCIFSVITMTSGFFLFAYVVGNFMDIIELLEAENREFNAKMGAVRNLLARFKLPPGLEDRLKTFFFFKRFHSITQEHILERCLPPSLLTDIRLVHLKPMIAKVAFLSGMEGSVTRMLVSQFSQCVVLRGQFVCRYGEEGSDMYFIFTGILDVLMPAALASSNGETDHDGANESVDKPVIKRSDSATSFSAVDALKKVNELSAGSYFGENGLFTKSLRNAHVRAQTSCILYKLSRDSLELVFERYPAWKQKVIRIANLQNEQQRLNRLSKEEQSRHTDEAGGSMLSNMDMLNRRAEKMEEEMHLVRIQRSTSLKAINTSSPPSSAQCLRIWDRLVCHEILVLVRKLRDGAEAQSPLHLVWMQTILCCTVYMAVIVPYRIALDSLNRSTPMVNLAKGLEIFCELMFAADIWFSVHVKECPASMELYEQSHIAMYKKERMLWDVIAAVPVYHIVLDFGESPYLRLFHCVKVMNITSYLSELNRRSVHYELDRFRGIWLLYVLIMYWVACAYLSIAAYEEYGDEWNAWAPSTAVEIRDSTHVTVSHVALRLCRGMFYATTAFVKKARTFVPDSVTRYLFSLACSYIGLLVMSFMIGEVASLFISFIGVEVDFRRSHIAVELYLARLRVSSTLSSRAHAFMFSLWSSHSGINYETIFQEISPSIRVACALHIAQQPLEWFMRTVFRPLSYEGSSELEALTASIAHELRFEGYPRDEFVVREGSISQAMYFVVKGHLTLQSTTLAAFRQPVGIRAGDYFGERGLLGAAVSTFSVRSIRASDLLSLSSESLLKVMNSHAVSRIAFVVAQESYRRLKSELNEPCSVAAMEDNWGSTLMKVLREHIHINVPHSVKHRASSVYTEHANESSDLQKRWKSMARTFDDPSECYSAFHGLLHIISPNDPLDWHASFSHSLKLASAPRDAERRRSFTQALADFGMASPSVTDESTSPTCSDEAVAMNGQDDDGEVFAATSTSRNDVASLPITSAQLELSNTRTNEALCVSEAAAMCEESASIASTISDAVDTKGSDECEQLSTRVGPSADLIPLHELETARSAIQASSSSVDHTGDDSAHTLQQSAAVTASDGTRSTITIDTAPVPSSGDTEQLVHETELVAHALSHVNELKGVPPKYAHMQLPPLVVASIAEPVNGSSEHGIDADAASQ